MYLDVTVEDGLGESLQGGALILSQAGLHVQMRNSGCVSGQGRRVGVTKGLEVVVDRMTNYHFPHEQLQDLSTEVINLLNSRGLHRTFTPVKNE